jgi:hypothetical protein
LEFEQISIWIYSGFIGGGYSYAHYLVLFEVLLNSASDGVIVAEFFRGLLGAALPPVGGFFSRVDLSSSH